MTIQSMDEKISSMNESVNCGLWISYINGGTSHMDEIVIFGCHPWIKKPHPWITSMNEEDR